MQNTFKPAGTAMADLVAGIKEPEDIAAMCEKSDRMQDAFEKLTKQFYAEGMPKQARMVETVRLEIEVETSARLYDIIREA